MIIIEYRVPMPFTADEYRIGQLYTIAKKSKIESADSKNGVKINANEPYTSGPGGSGQYTNKTYYLANKLPDWLKRILPDSAAKLKEEAWNAFPYSRNKFTNPLLEKLQLEIESRYIDGPPTMENVFNLTKKEEASKSIVIIDLTQSSPSAARSNSDKSSGKKSSSKLDSFDSIHDTKADCNNEILSFDPMFREPLSCNWLQEYATAHNKGKEMNDGNRSDVVRDIKNFHYNNTTNYGDDDDVMMPKKSIMTCYKLCRVNFPVWPLQTKVEQFIQQYSREMITESHRQTWLWQDEWTGMSIEQIREIERETQRDLVAMMQSLN